MYSANSNPCPDCESPSRREFLKSSIAVPAATAAVGLAMPGILRAAPAKAPAETLVASLYKTLTEEQRKEVAFDFNHRLRSMVDNNWMIVKQPIAKFFNKDQQAMIRDIFMSMHSEEYAARVYGQVEHDNKSDGGFGGCSVAFFGEPGVGKFEFVFTGRHVTRRCDGNSVEGAAFGGPIFYGHAADGFNEKPDHPGNVYWHQAVRANEVFKSLDGKLRAIALLDSDAPEERQTDTVKLAGKGKPLPGIPMTELSRDHKGLVRKVLADLLAPFRKADADEALKLIEAAGFDNLHMAFYSKHDVGKDGVWDVWQIQGPGMMWYFRGDPHVHTWVHIRDVEKV